MFRTELSHSTFFDLDWNRLRRAARLQRRKRTSRSMSVEVVSICMSKFKRKALARTRTTSWNKLNLKRVDATGTRNVESESRQLPGHPSRQKYSTLFPHSTHFLILIHTTLRARTGKCYAYGNAIHYFSPAVATEGFLGRRDHHSCSYTLYAPGSRRLVSRWIGAEQAVERTFEHLSRTHVIAHTFCHPSGRVKFILVLDDPLTPGLLYVGLATGPMR